MANKQAYSVTLAGPDGRRETASVWARNRETATGEALALAARKPGGPWRVVRIETTTNGSA